VEYSRTEWYVDTLPIYRLLHRSKIQRNLVIITLRREVKSKFRNFFQLFVYVLFTVLRSSTLNCANDFLCFLCNVIEFGPRGTAVRDALRKRAFIDQCLHRQFRDFISEYVEHSSQFQPCN